MERRLAAILAADVVGYSRLMGEDQAGTLEALRHLRSELFAPALKNNRGHLIKSMGDGWIVEFPSISDAVACALHIQEGLASYPKVALRIGVHTGEVVFEAEDFFGDGVNVAARLEALAEPGQVLLSDNAYQSLDQRTAVEFGGGEARELKNIARPVGVWCWPADTAVRATTAGAGAGAAAADSEMPSIAVLPFENLSGGSDQDFFADGISEDIITALSKFRWLRVMARNSSFGFKGQAMDVRDIGKSLGVRYVLEGSIRRAGERVRITGQLVDASDGAHIWADRFDGVISDIFELQDQVSRDVICAIEPSLRQAEIDRARKKPTEDLQAYELYLRAQSHFHLLTDQDNQEAIRLLSLAVDRDPGYAIASGLLGWCFVQRAVQKWALEPDAPQKAIGLARGVLESDRADAMALAYAAHTLMMFAGDHERARSAFERSLTENPNSALAHTLCAANCSAMLQLEHAIHHADQALRLSPRDTFRYSFHFARALPLFLLGRYEEASEAAKASVMDRGNFLMSRFVLIAALVLKGDLAAGRAAAAELRAMAPEITVAAIRQSAPFFKSESAAELHRALEDAGVPRS